jgi:hypothetical protein
MASRTHSGERAAAGAVLRRRGRLSAGRAGGVGRALVEHEHRTAAGLLALLVLVFLWPALIEGHLLVPSAMQFEAVPWRGHGPAGFKDYVNLELGDVPASFYPWNVLARELLHSGTFPAWNPHAFAGTPFFANYEVAWLSPFSLPLWILPLDYGLGVAAALKLWMAGFGTYLLVRELRLGFWPGLLAGIAFALCAFNVVWLTHGVQVSVAALLPWCIWLVERIVRRGRGVDGLALAAVVACVVAGGHPGTQVHVLAGALLYALLRTALSGDLPSRDRVQRLATVGGAMVLGTLLMAVVLLPASRAAVETAGLAARQSGETFIGSNMTFDTLRTALFPDWWGRPSEQAFLGPANYRERTFYAGSIALLLAFAGLLSRGAWRRTLPFALLGAGAALIAVRGPLLYDLVVDAPLFDRVQNQRILLWFSFAVAVLSAFGLQALLEAPRGRLRTLGVAVAGLLVALLAAGSLRIEGGTFDQAAEYLVRRSADVSPTETVLALASIGWWLVFVAALAAILAVALLAPRRRWLVGALVVAVAALDMLHFADGYQPMGPRSQVMPATTPAIAYLQRHTDDGRIAGYEFSVPPDWSTIYGLRDARGYDAPQPSLRFARLWRAIEPRQAYVSPFWVRNFEPLTLQVLGLLGVRYIAVTSEAEVRLEHVSVAYAGRDAKVLRNDLAMPRAIVAEQVLVAETEEEEIAAVTGDFDPRRDAVVRADELTPTSEPASGIEGSARVVDESNARVTLRATLPRTGLVVLNDAWAPGWSVTVDGRPARALQADVVLRGVVVPAGTHTIEWSYEVPGLRAGLGVSGLALALLAAWAGLLLLLRASDRRGSASGTSPQGPNSAAGTTAIPSGRR